MPPSEFRADAVVIFKDERDVARLAVVVEVQHTLDYRKRYTWPVYLSATRARENCPTLLFVIAKDAEIAAFARASIDLGHPGFMLAPIVISPDQIPRIEDLETARRLPRLAVLSALTHHSTEIAALALSVLDSVSPAYVEIYRDVIISKFSLPEQETLEVSMSEYYEWQSALAKKQIAELKAASRTEGLAEGQQQGRLESQQATVIRLAQLHLGPLSAEQESKIRALRDDEQLFQLILELGRASSAALAAQALERL